MTKNLNNKSGRNAERVEPLRLQRIPRSFTTRNKLTPFSKE